MRGIAAQGAKLCRRKSSEPGQGKLMMQPCRRVNLCPVSTFTSDVFAATLCLSLAELCTLVIKIYGRQVSRGGVPRRTELINFCII